MIVEGKVLRLWTSRGKGTHHHVAYAYAAVADSGERVLQGEDTIPATEFNRLEIGGPLAVKVCRTDPVNHIIPMARARAFTDPWGFPIALIFLGILGLAGIVNLGWWWACRGPARHL